MNVWRELLKCLGLARRLGSVGLPALVIALGAALALLPSAGAFSGAIHDLAVTPADFTVLGADSGDNMGYSAAAGDFNGDGIDDLLVGANAADAAGNAKTLAGEAYVVFGSTTLSGSHDLLSTPADFTVLGADAVDFLGRSVAAGDFNGDGIDDLLVGADAADAVGNAKSSAGEAYVIFGSASLSGTRDLSSSPADFTVLGAASGHNLGTSVAAGDFNADGIEDLLVGAAYADPGTPVRSNAGEAYVIFGSASLSGTHDLATSPADFTVLGGEANGFLGSSAATGDFDADGIEDVLLGAYQANAWAGGAYVIFGSTTLSGSRDLATAAADFTVLGADASDYLGYSAAAGDFNGDGIDDLLLGADQHGSTLPGPGEAHVIFGSTTLSGTRDLATTAADFTVLGADTYDKLGASAAGGDFDGDGIEDPLLGAREADAASNAKSNAGEAYVVVGSPSLGGTLDLAAASPDLSVLGADAGDCLGTSAAAGDFNGDSIDDLLMGAYKADGPGNAYVIFGSAPGDSDGDGWTDQAEQFIGTDPQNACVPNGWPPDPRPAPDGNGVVQVDDVTFAASSFGSTTSPRAEIASQNGAVQIDDVTAFASRFGEMC